MPLPLIPLAIAAVVGGGTVWFASDLTEKLVKTTAVLGGSYLVYKLFIK